MRKKLLFNEKGIMKEIALRSLLIVSFVVLCPGSIWAQNTAIKGRVIDSKTRGALVGVSVSEAGTVNGTLTDVDGNFSLSVSPEATLEVRYMGYETQSVPVKGQTSFEIYLDEDSKVLDEVVVVGYGSQSKRKVTTAVGTVNSEDLLRSSSTTTAGALTGKMAGISTRAKDSRPGRGIDLQVRNMGNPLYVIDGIPYGGDTRRDWLGISLVSGNDAFNALSLEDIESITVLKDASAAIYGLRASNGVVLVTTKKGRMQDKVTINLNAYYGWQNLTRFPKLANAAQYVRGLVEAEQNAGKDPSSLYTKEELAKWEAGKEPGYRGYDYYDIIMRKNVPQYNVNANVTGGSSRSSYYMSLSHTGQEAMMKEFNYKRTNFQSNLSTNVFKGLTVGTQIYGKLEETKDVGLQGGDGYFSSILGVFANRPTVGPYANDNPNYINKTPNRADLNPATFKRSISGYKDSYTKNININLFAEYKFDFGLSAKYTYSYNYTDIEFSGFQYSYDQYTYDPNEETYEVKGGQEARWRFETLTKAKSTYSQFQLNYEKTFGDHSISAVFGYERSDWDKMLKWREGSPKNNYIPAMNYTTLKGGDDEWTYQARSGYIGRVNYSYKDKYLFEFLCRYDASYLYAPGKRWGFFPGVSAGWRISDEPFFEKLKTVVSDMKLRASVGQTGHESGVDVFGYIPGYSYGRNDKNEVVGGSVLDGEYVIGLMPNGLPVRNLSWEKHTTYNIGLDASFFGHKLMFTMDVFTKVMSGRPAARYDVLLPSEVGYTLPNENLDKDAQRGIEAMITYTNRAGELKYTVSGNISYSRFRHISTYKPRFGNSWNKYRDSKEDRWGGIWWGYQVIGRFQSEEQIRNHPINNDGKNNTTQLPGDFIYKDVNGDGIIDGLDERPIGYPHNWTPMLTFGGNIGLEWKGIDLNLDFAGAAMQSWNQNYELRNPFHAGGNSAAYLLTDRWHREDPYDPDSKWIPGRYPAIRNNTSLNNGKNSDFWLHNVRFFRLKNAEIGYTLPRGLLDKVHISRARVYVSGSNLFSIDNVRKYGIDPEIQAEAAVVYPQQRTIMVGINLTF